MLAAYDAMGRPANPTQAQIVKLRNSAELPPPEETLIKDGQLELAIPPDGLALIELQ